MLNERSFIPDEYDTEMEDYSSQNDETYEERPVKTKKTIVEDLGSETTALVQQDSGDSDADKHKGCKYTVLTRAYLTFYYIDQFICLISVCHWGIAVWYKPGFAIRCSCMQW